MSEVTPDPITTVAPEVEGAPANIVEDANAHTPVTPTPPNTDGSEGLAELRTIVGGLAQAVQSLTDLVTSTVKDETPSKPPWTHIGSKPKE